MCEPCIRTNACDHLRLHWHVGHPLKSFTYTCPGGHALHFRRGHIGSVQMNKL